MSAKAKLIAVAHSMLLAKVGPIIEKTNIYENL